MFQNMKCFIQIKVYTTVVTDKKNIALKTGKSFEGENDIKCLCKFSILKYWRLSRDRPCGKCD